MMDILSNTVYGKLNVAENKRLKKTVEMPSAAESVNKEITQNIVENTEKIALNKNPVSKKTHPQSLLDQNGETSANAADEEQSTTHQQDESKEAPWYANAENLVSSNQQGNSAVYDSMGASEDGGADEDPPKVSELPSVHHFLDITAADWLGIGTVVSIGVGAMGYQKNDNGAPPALTITPQSKINDATPTISGIGTPGGKITAVTPAGETLTATVQSDGTWTVTPSKPLPDGQQIITVTETNSAGQSTEKTANITVDTTAPAAPTTALAAASDSGTLGDKITNDTTPTINGTAEPGAKITVVSPTGETMTATAAANGTWSVTPTTALPSSATPQTFSITATDAAGNTSAPATLPLTIDNTPPAAPTTALAAASDSGTLGDNITNDTTPTINGTAEPGAKITVVSPTGETMTATAAANGTWSVTPTTALPSSATPQTFSITATDAAGNTSAPATLPLTIDNTPPAAPTTALAAASDSGTLGDKITNDTTPTINGTAEPGAKITVVSPTGETMTATAAANGTWSVTPTTALPSSATPQTFSITATDAAGNTSAPATLPLTIDNTPPAAPTTALAAASDSGTLGDSITNDTTPTINGTAEPGAKITVVSPTGETMTATAAANGTWSVTPTTALPSSATPQTFSITATDAAGNSSAPATLPLTIDNTPPAAPVAKLDPTSDSGIQGDGITNDTTPTISGTGSPGDKITVVSPTGETMTTTVSPTGTWSVTPLTVLASGSTPQTFSVTEADAAGNTSTANVPVIISAAAPTASTATLAAASDSGTLGDKITNDTTPTINGTAEPGAKITVVSPTGETMTATAAANGTWSVTPTTALPSSATPQTFSITATDAAGNTSAPATLPLTIDNTPPAAPTTALAAASDSGTLGDNITNDTTPTINGTAEPGAKITVVSPTGETMTATAAANGTWSVTPTTALPSSATPQTFSITATDAAGNTSAPATLPLTIDNTPPAAPTTALAAASDSGTLGDKITNDTTPTINGTAEPGAKITVVSPTGETMTATAAANGTWSVTPTTALPSSATPQTFSITATDAAGNTSAPATLPLTIDNTPPAAPTTALAAASDSGTLGDSITNDTTPTINGTAEPGAKITVVSPTGETMTATAAANGTWSVTPTTALPSSATPQTFSITATDAAGNSSAPATLPLTIDNTPPSVLTAGIAPASDTGTLGDSTTAINKPALTGLGDPGAKMTVVSPTGETMTATVDASGHWTVTPTTALSLGLNTLSVIESDAAGNTQTASLPVTIDTSTSAITVTITTDANNNGVINQVEWAAAATPLTVAIRVDLTTPSKVLVGDSLVVTDNFGHSTTISITSTDITNGYVTLTMPKPNEDQTITVTATLSNPHGGSSSNSDAALIDTTPPGTPTVEILADSNNDGYINSAELAAAGGSTSVRVHVPTVPGPGYRAAAANDVITIYAADGTTLLGTHTLTAGEATSGQYDFTGIAVPANGGTLTVLAQLKDGVGGNFDPGWSSIPSNPGKDIAVVDTSAAAPPTLALASDTGASSTDNITKVGTINVGSIEAGATWQYSTDGGTTWTTGGGTSFALPVGTYAAGAVQVRQTDTAGNVSTPTSSAAAITVDQSIALPTVGTSDPEVNGKINAAGTAEAGSTVTITWPDSTTSTVLANASGNWSLESPTMQVSGNVSVSAVDLAGNTSFGATTTFNAVVPTTTPTIVNYTDDVGPKTGSMLSGSTTDDTLPVLNGTLSAALASYEKLNIYDGGVLVGVATVTGTTWTFATPTLSTGTTHNYTAAVENTANQTGAASAALTLTVNTTVPALAPTITSITDDVGATTGTYTAQGSTDDTAPVINGTTSTTLTAFQHVEVYRDGVDVGAATYNSAAKTWTFQDTGLAIGSSYVYTANIAMNATGATGPASNSWTESIIPLQLAPVTPDAITPVSSYMLTLMPLGDYNNDGFNDMSLAVYSSSAGTQQQVWEGSTNATTPMTAAITTGIASALVNIAAWAGDINADGKVDIGGNGNLGKIYFNGGGLSNSMGGANALGIGDVNGNGLMDVLESTSNGASSTNYLYFSNGTNTLTLGGTITGTMYDEHNPLWYYGPAGDVNGDGIADFVTSSGIVFGSPTLGNINLATIPGVQFTHSTNYALNDEVMTRGVGDINGDGYADVGIIDKATSLISIIYGGTSATAVDPSAPGARGVVITHPPYTTGGMVYFNIEALGDMNGDGIGDILLNIGDYSDATKGKTYVVFGTPDNAPIDLSQVGLGNGGFLTFPPSNNLDGSHTVAATGDINGDGIVDFVATDTNISSLVGNFYTYLGGAKAGFVPTVSGATAAGTVGSDLIQGTTGADVVHGNGGTDVIYTGAGNDIIHINSSNISALYAGYDAAARREARIDGGSGVDALAIDGSNTTLDLTRISFSGQVNAVDTSRITSIEKVDLTGVGSASNTLQLSLNDVMSMNTGFNTYHTGAVNGVNDLTVTASTTTSVGALVQRHQLMVDGDSTDTVTIAGMANWTTASAGTVQYNGHTYAVYNTVGANQAQLLIDQAVHVNFIA